MPKKLLAYKFPIFLAFLILIFSTIVGSQQLIKNVEQTKPQPEVKEVSTTSPTSDNVTAEIKEGQASVNIENKTNVASEQTNSGSVGTCKITKNGVVSYVPADQVKINEKSSNDINLKVECESSINQSNGGSTNKSSFSNNIQLEVNKSP